MARVVVMVTLLAVAALAVVPTRVEGFDCGGVPAMRMVVPDEERENAYFADPGTACNQAASDRMVLMAAVGAVGFVAWALTNMAARRGEERTRSQARSGRPMR